MTKRRDLFIFVADPDGAEGARKYLSDWLRQFDGHPGYLGGFVLKSTTSPPLACRRLIHRPVEGA